MLTASIIGSSPISEQTVPCGKCKFCKTGCYWMCGKHDLYGLQNNINGGMAEYMRFPYEGPKAQNSQGNVSREGAVHRTFQMLKALRGPCEDHERRFCRAPEWGDSWPQYGRGNSQEKPAGSLRQKNRTSSLSKYLQQFHKGLPTFLNLILLPEIEKSDSISLVLL